MDKDFTALDAFRLLEEKLRSASIRASLEVSWEAVHPGH